MIILKKKRKNNNTTLLQNKTTASYQQPKIENVNNRNNKNGTFVIGLSNCGKTCLMIFFLLKKTRTNFYNHKITKSIY